MKTSRERHPAVDALRVLAILAVVAIHTSTRTIEAVNGSIDTLPVSFLLNQISRFAVPLFFLISGYVLELSYQYHQNYVSYLKKRFNRIFFPYVVWSAFYYFLVYPVHSVNFFEALIGGNASYQLYFIPTLLIFYIVFPLLHELYPILSNKFVISALIVIQIVLLARDYYVHPFPIFFPVDIALLNYSFFVIGMIISRNHTAVLHWAGRNIRLLFLALIISGVVVCEEARVLYLATHNYLDYYSSWRPSIFVYTLSFAGVFYYLFENYKRFNGLAHKLSELSFFVFFVHVAILELFWTFIGKTLFEAITTPLEQPLFLIFFFLVVTGVSYGIAALVHKLPQLSKVTG